MFSMVAAAAMPICAPTRMRLTCQAAVVSVRNSFIELIRGRVSKCFHCNTISYFDHNSCSWSHWHNMRTCKQGFNLLLGHPNKDCKDSYLRLLYNHSIINRPNGFELYLPGTIEIKRNAFGRVKSECLHNLENTTIPWILRRQLMG